jgi:large subunit ribosomal protein L23
MALFNKKTEEKKTKKVIETRIKNVAMSEANQAKLHISGSTVKFFLMPRITEKATLLSENNVYTFTIPKGANKVTVAAAVKDLFKVTPIKVAIVRTMGKTKITKGKMGKTAETKKAYVYLKKGEKIEFV